MDMRLGLITSVTEDQNYRKLLLFQDLLPYRLLIHADSPGKKVYLGIVRVKQMVWGLP